MEYSLEQLNYFRICRIVVKLVPAGLRKIFKQEWDFRYSTTPCGMWQDTPQNGNDFHLKETMAKRRKPVMVGRSLSTIQNGNTAEWDCSCLFSAILYSDSIGTTLSPTVQSNVDDLRKVRNNIAHITEDMLTDAQFQSYTVRVLNAFTTLGLSIKKIDHVKNQTGFPTAEVEALKEEINGLKTELDQTKSKLETTENELQSAKDDLSAAKEQNEVLTQEINSNLEPFCSLPFTPPHEIIRRGSDLARITKRMHELYDSSNGAVSTIYLSGNPGCGKSQLARQIGEEFYSVRSRDTQGLIFVATLNAETLESLADSYLTLAANLSIPLYVIKELEKSKTNEPKETLNQAMRMVRNKIATFSNWLIIADNVVDLKSVRSFFPQTASKEWGHGQVLITTQDSITIPSNAPHTYHESLKEGMQRGDAVELLKRVSQISNQEKIEKVAEVLEYQPLPLAAAAFYVQTVVSGGSLDYSWTEYLIALRKGEREATEEVLAEQSVTYLKPMTKAVKMAIQRAMEISDVISQTFALFSLCASEPVTVDVVVSFVKARLESHMTEELIRATILKSSLIVSEEVEDGAPKYLRLHGIVHDVLKTLPLFDSDYTKKLRCIAASINIFESQLLEHLSRAEYGHRELRRFTSHSKVLCCIAFSNSDTIASLLKTLTPFVKPDRVVSWLRFTAAACLELSDLSHAERLSQLACDLLHYVSMETQGSLLRSQVFETRGSVLNRVCDFNSSLSCHQEALDIRIKLYVVCRNFGQHDQAKEFYEKALNIQNKLYGEEHGAVAASYNNLGVVCRNIGEHHQAKEFYEKALNIQIKLYGEKHGAVATSYNNLGVVYRNIEEHYQAKAFHEKALNIQIKLYGEEHGDVAASYNNLGVFCRNFGQHHQAKEFYEKALNIQIKLYGEEHGDVAKSYKNLAVVYRNIGQHDQAKEFHEKALNIQIKLYGEEHGAVAASYNNLGVVCRNIGEHHQAKEFYEKALNIQIKLYGEKHGAVATSYNNLGVVYRNIEEHYQAKAFHEKALNIQIKLYGEEHGDVAASYNNLGVVCRNIGEHHQAKEFYEKALNIQIKLYGEEHGAVATSYNNLGVVCRNIGEHHQAKEFYEKALNIQIKLYGEEHGDVAASYNNLGVVCRKIGEHDQAKEFYEKALNIQIKLYGEEHGAVATSYNNLGVVCRNIGEHHQAKEFYEKALNIQIKLYGEEHGDVAKSYKNLAVVCRSIGQHDQAKKFHEKALNIQRRLLNPDHIQEQKSEIDSF